MSFDNIRRIILNSTSSSDQLAYQLVGNLTGPRRLDVDLGNGRDSFVALIGGSLLPGAGLEMNVTGHNGRDTVQESVTGNLLDGSALVFNVNGSRASNQVGAFSTGALFPNARSVVTFNGGPGNDTFLGAFSGPMFANSAVVWRINGGSGNNTLSGFLSTQMFPGAVFLMGLLSAGPSTTTVIADNMTVGPGAFFGALVVGGNGPNTLTNGFKGLVLGGVWQVSLGSNSPDVISQRTLLDPGSDIAGGVTSVVEGSGGNDNLLDEIRPGSLRRGVTALLDGGPGFNIGRATRNVRVRNCQVVIRI
jgi:hypothetical protein